LAERVADVIEAQLARAVAERGAASLAVSGGSTPADLYAALSQRAIDWRKTAAALVDERWVRPGADGSNETFVSKTLLQNRAESLSLEGMWRDTRSPQDALADVQSRYAALQNPFDVVVLGMGNDGHTASWFPNAAGMADALSDDERLVAAVTARKSNVTGDHLERMTMTLGAVARARFIFLLIAGEEKRSVFLKALKEGPVIDMPVRAILKRRPDLWVCWAR
jgi:6-phosphogluconolactonase